MKVNKKRAGIAAGLAAAGVLVIAPAAMATNTLHVGGSSTPLADVPITAPNKTTLSFLTDFGIPTTCATATIAGYIKKGASVTAGTRIGGITSLSFTNCGFTAFVPPLPVVIEKKGSAEWGIFVSTTPATKNALLNVEIRGVSAVMHSTGSMPYGCDVNVSLRPGKVVKGTFNETTQQLIINTGTDDPLLLDAMNGYSAKPNTSTATCLGGQIQDGDVMSMTGTFNVSTGGAGTITNN